MADALMDHSTRTQRGFKFSVERIAQVCHEANAAICSASGDYSQELWENAPDWQKESAILGVEFHLSNPDAHADAGHNNWSTDKLADGWTYGPVKSPEAKEHPCLVPFDQLPFEQQVKDHVFKELVRTLGAM